MNPKGKKLGLVPKSEPRPDLTPPERPRGKRKNLCDDPEVRSMSEMLHAGRSLERMDILEELEGRLRGDRGWWKDNGESPEDALRSIKRWVEARHNEPWRVD